MRGLGNLERDRLDLMDSGHMYTMEVMARSVGGLHAARVTSPFFVSKQLNAG